MASHPEFGKETTSEQVVDAFAEKIRGRSVIITGVSRNGLGEAMARAIASKSPSLLVLAARSTSKAEAVSKHLGVDFPFVDTRLLSLNLSSQKSVRQAAIELKYMTKAVDVLMNNAAVVAVYERTLSEDGEEIQFAINYMVYFLFTNLIMNKLPLSANQIPQSGARMSTLLALGTSSHPCDLAIIDLRGDRSLMKSSQTRPWLHERGCLNWTHRVIAYCQSDTANTLFTTELGANLYEQGRLISAPGVVEIELQRRMLARDSETRTCFTNLQAKAW